MIFSKYTSWLGNVCLGPQQAGGGGEEYYKDFLWNHKLMLLVLEATKRLMTAFKLSIAWS